MEKQPTDDAVSGPDTVHKYTELRFGGSGIISFSALMPGKKVKAKDSDGVIRDETIDHLVFANGSGYFVYAIVPNGRKGIKHVQKMSKKVREREKRKAR